MADHEQLAKLLEGAETWNSWRSRNPGVRIDLSNAKLADAKLAGIDLNGADLTGANFPSADLSSACLQRANLTSAKFDSAQLARADLTSADLTEATGRMVSFSDAVLNDACLDDGRFSDATFLQVTARRTTFRRCALWGADFVSADLEGADFAGAQLMDAKFDLARLVNANMSDADLRWVSLVKTEATGARFSRARIYGTAIWDLVGDPADQSALSVWSDEATITVDDLRVAQFIYLLSQNDKIRNIINAVTAKAVLILGRFTPERKRVLDAMRERLANVHGYVPILFDFKPASSRSLTETVQFLAQISCFVIADITDAKSIPQELSAIVPHLPSLPVQPLIEASKGEYGMFEHWTRYPNLLPLKTYRDLDHALDTLKDVVEDVTEWRKHGGPTAALREEITRLTKELKALKAARTDRAAGSGDTTPRD